MASYKVCEGNCNGTTYFLGYPLVCPILEKMEHHSGKLSWEGEPWSADKTLGLSLCELGPGGLVKKVDEKPIDGIQNEIISPIIQIIGVNNL